MKRTLLLSLIVTLILVVIIGAVYTYSVRTIPDETPVSDNMIILPQPILDSEFSVEESLAKRRSVRDYSAQSLSLAEISQLLWAAQGVNRPGGYRTAPSAGALYPLEIYLVSGQVDDLPAGVYRYSPEEHGLNLVLSGDIRQELSKAALGQDSIQNAPAVIVITAVHERTTVKYSNRGIQYVHMEVGSAAENVYLQAESLGLGTVFIGACHDDQVSQVLELDGQEQPLCIMPVGRPRH